MITVKRNPGFFLWKFQIKDRVNRTLTGILTSDAYGSTIARHLPEHVFDTCLDAVVITSLLYSEALMLLNIVSSASTSPNAARWH